MQYVYHVPLTSVQVGWVCVCSFSLRSALQSFLAFCILIPFPNPMDQLDPETISKLLEREDIASELKSRTDIRLTELLEDDGLVH